ncbi:hypothetical protein N7471_011453 [Penicillium samsonianum]|uniref:uncharacterized protein n=1 Tax=Penicillium samsonianum TaxID=1882272 RepID=UPI002546753C|nr:uncharacterized protein N7471_011453 [Penicillium samsonianum]KAJ6124136.1 hypothetical protein N7471_011453 [Penicillium samsonianum]
MQFSAEIQTAVEPFTIPFLGTSHVAFARRITVRLPITSTNYGLTEHSMSYEHELLKRILDIPSTPSPNFLAAAIPPYAQTWQLGVYDGCTCEHFLGIGP